MSAASTPARAVVARERLIYTASSSVVRRPSSLARRDVHRAGGSPAGDAARPARDVPGAHVDAPHARTAPMPRSTRARVMSRAVVAVAFAVAVLARPMRATASGSSRSPARVTCGSALKLVHGATKHALSSQSVAYATGSGQQSVTAVRSSDEGAYWMIEPALGGATCARGEAIAPGTTIRLRHVATRAWLHSHLHRSPLSGNNEVSCFGGDGSSDTGDHWVVELPNGGDAWERGKKVRLKHKDTGAYLSSHNMKYGRPIAGHQEVMGAASPGSNALWTSAEGVYFPTSEEQRAKDEL